MNAELITVLFLAEEAGTDYKMFCILRNIICSTLPLLIYHFCTECRIQICWLVIVNASCTTPASGYAPK